MRNHCNQPITFKKFNYMQLKNDLAFPKRNLPRGPFFWSSIWNFKGMYSTIKPSNISNPNWNVPCQENLAQMFHPNSLGSLGHAASGTPLVPKLCHGLREVDKDTPRVIVFSEVESFEKLNYNTTPLKLTAILPLKTRPKMTPILGNYIVVRIFPFWGANWLLVSGRVFWNGGKDFCGVYISRYM